MNCTQAIRLLVTLFLLASSVSSAQADAQIDRYALIMGVKGYPNFPLEKRLQYADRDAQRFAKFIQTREGGLFRPENIRLLTNEQVTRPNIYNEIKWIANRAVGDALVYVFFAGHGILDDLSQAYFMPFDADLQNPAALGIRADLFLDELRKRVNAKYMIFFVDACYAGAALVPGAAERGDEPNVAFAIQNLLPKLPTERDSIAMAILSASSNQRSWEIDTFQQGLFTHYLLKGLAGAADREPTEGVVTAGKLLRYLVDEVEKYSTAHLKLQTPTRSPAFDPKWPLAWPTSQQVATLVTAPTPQDSLRSFSFDYGFEPLPGKRHWRQVDQFTWVERYHTGFESKYRVVGQTDVNGVHGTLLIKFEGDEKVSLVPNNSSFQVFIPDKSPKPMAVLFRHFWQGQWQDWKVVAVVQENPS